MGNSGCNTCRTNYFCCSRVIILKNIFMMVSTLILYCFNQKYKTQIEQRQLNFFMNCYFNDIIGSITFLSNCNLVFIFNKKYMVKITHILTLILLCGIFWEYITPLFRKNTISDYYDLLAYTTGGFLYWVINKL